MIGPETKLLLDTNMLIKAANEYYHPNRSVTFWAELHKQIETGAICILDVVADELIWRAMKKKDADRERFISKWSREHIDPYRHKAKNDPDILMRIPSVLDFLKTGPYYSHVYKQWDASKIADPWLIAAGIAYPNCTVVTDEKTQGPLGRGDKLKEAKIPLVCEHFGVSWTRSIYDVMNELNMVADQALLPHQT